MQRHSVRFVLTSISVVRGEDHKRETYRVVAGVEGTFNDDWKYEVAFNYGHLDTFYKTNGNILIGQVFQFGRCSTQWCR